MDASGAALWGAVLAGAAGETAALGRTVVIDSLFQSSEARQDVVGGLYQEFLGRPADSGGLTGFVSELQSGLTIDQVAVAMLASNEFLAR